MGHPLPDWIGSDRPPRDLYELLGRPRFDPDADGLLEDVRAAHRRWRPALNHPRPEVVQRARDLLAQLGKSRDVFGDPAKHAAYDQGLIQSLAKEFAQQQDRSAQTGHTMPLRLWLTEAQDVHPDRLDSVFATLLLVDRSDSTAPKTRSDGRRRRAPQHPAGSRRSPAPPTPRSPQPVRDSNNRHPVETDVVPQESAEWANSQRDAIPDEIKLDPTIPTTVPGRAPRQKPTIRGDRLASAGSDIIPQAAAELSGGGAWSVQTPGWEDAPLGGTPTDGVVLSLMFLGVSALLVCLISFVAWPLYMIYWDIPRRHDHRPHLILIIPVLASPFVMWIALKLRRLYRNSGGGKGVRSFVISGLTGVAVVLSGYFTLLLAFPLAFATFGLLMAFCPLFVLNNVQRILEGCTGEKSPAERGAKKKSSPDLAEWDPF